MMAKVDQFLDSLVNYDKENINPNILTALEVYLKDKGLENNLILRKYKISPNSHSTECDKRAFQILILTSFDQSLGLQQACALG